MLAEKGGIIAVSGCVNNQPALCRAMLSDFNIATQIDCAHFIFEAKCSQKCFKNEMFLLQRNQLAGPKQLLVSGLVVRLQKWGAGWGNHQFQPWPWGCQQALTSWFDLQFPITFLGSDWGRLCLWPLGSLSSCISSSWGCCPVVTLGPAALSPAEQSPVPSLALPSPLCSQGSNEPSNPGPARE